MKSAYELALERLEAQGIERPDAGALSDEARQRMSEVRQKAQAKLAQLEILHQERLTKAASYGEREEEDEEYRLERRRIEADRDAALEAIRRGS